MRMFGNMPRIVRVVLEVLRIWIWTLPSMSKIILTVVLTAAQTLSLGGCSHGAPATPPERSISSRGPKAGSNAPTFVRDGYQFNDIASHFFGVEGTVLDIHSTPTTLRSMTIKVLRSLDTAVGYEPFSSGETAIIHFDEPLSNFAGLRLTNGKIVQIYFGQVSKGWVANSAWVSVETNGAIYGRNGTPVGPNGGGLFPRADARAIDSAGSD